MVRVSRSVSITVDIYPDGGGYLGPFRRKPLPTIKQVVEQEIKKRIADHEGEAKKLRELLADWYDPEAEHPASGVYPNPTDLRAIAFRLSQLPQSVIIAGEYSISQRDGRIWLENQIGEGMECDPRSIESLLAVYFEANF
jgi:hypothetical protein